MTMDNLLEEINNWYHTHGEYPTVKVSESFWDDNWYDLLTTHGFVEIDDTINEDWRLV